MAFKTITEQTMDYVGGTIGHDTQKYSGRAMYGQECLAIVVDNTSAWQVSRDVHAAVSEADEEEQPVIQHMIDHEPRTDSLGLGTVLYWPTIKIEG